MKKISKLQISRLLTQIIFLALLPGLFTLAFNQSKEIYTMIINGNFNFIESFPTLIEIFALISLTVILGRFFCGWMCAFGTMNDVLYLISKKVFKLNFKVSEEVDSVLKYVKYVLLVVLVVVAWTFGSTIFDGASPWDAFAQIPNFSEAINAYAIGSVLLTLIIVGAMFIERFFCRYLCPMGAIFAITSKLRIFNINKPTEKCGKCRVCTNNCAMGIPLYEKEKVRSSECVNCLKCVTSCPRKNAQAAILDENINPALGSAVAVAAFAGIYSVSNVLANNVTASATEISTTTTQSGTTSSSAATTYKDGTYTGTGNGYRPNLNVSVTIKNDKITAITIGSNNETPSYAQRPFSTIPQAIIKAQSTKVDTISGATRTCRGIIAAVEDALTDAKAAVSTASSNSATSNSSTNSSTSSVSNSNQNSSSVSTSNSGSTANSAASGSATNSGTTASSNNTTSTSNSGTTPSTGTTNSSTPAANSNTATTNNSSTASNSTTNSTSGSTSSSSSTTTTKVYKDGTYTGTGNGYKPGLNVSVTIKDNKITNIQIGANNETPRYAQRPFSTIPQQIIASQSTKVDTISGATRTCKGIIMAVEDALADAKV